MEKICNKCKLLIDVNKFYKNNSTIDGLQYTCIACMNKRYRASEYKQAEEIRREKRRPYQKKYQNKYMCEYQKRPTVLAKNKTRNRTNYLIRKGEIKKKHCEECGDIKVQAHHDDYDDAYKVRFLCCKCHSRVHNNLKYDYTSGQDNRTNQHERKEIHGATEQMETTL